MTKPKAKKKHLSNTQMDMYCRCGELYRQCYVEGKRQPPGIAAMKGQGIHAAAQSNMSQKIDSHVDIPVKDYVEIAVETFRNQQHGEYSLTPEEQSRGSKVVFGEAADSVAEMASVSGSEQMRDYQPISTELQVRIELPNSERDLLGIIDLIDDKGRVVDFKTANRAKQQSEADSSVQLGIYAVSYQAMHGKPPTELRLDTIVQTKTKTTRQILSTHRTADDFAALAARVTAVQAGIDAGIFHPAPPGSWYCSPKFCGFANTCPYVSFRDIERVR